VTLRRTIVLLLTAVATISARGGGHAQEAGGNIETVLPDCKALIESSQKVESSLRKMLAEVRRQLSEAEKLSKAVGPDASEDSLVLFSDQQKHLSAMLRELQMVDCGPHPPTH
jgi:hypothetical protein